MLSSVWRDCTQKTCTIYMSYRVCRAQTTCMHVCSRDAQDSVDPHWSLTSVRSQVPGCWEPLRAMRKKWGWPASDEEAESVLPVKGRATSRASCAVSSQWASMESGGPVCRCEGSFGQVILTSVSLSFLAGKVGTPHMVIVRIKCYGS